MLNGVKDNIMRDLCEQFKFMINCNLSLVNLIAYQIASLILVIIQLRMLPRCSVFSSVGKSYWFDSLSRQK